MTKKLLLLLVLCLLPALACNLTSGGDNQSPRSNVPTVPIIIGGDREETPTPTLSVDVTQTPTPTPTTASSSGSSGSGSTARPSFSNLSFSSSAAGANISAFPQGTKDVYIRWSYANVPSGTQMTREWYRDGVLVASNSETWSASWGATGRLTHIHLFDYTAGLASGNYYVVVKLPSHGVQIDGRFSIAAAAPTFTNLSFSSTSAGNATQSFPYGTQEVYARWDFTNVPTGAVMRRVWYRNNQQIISREEAWSSTWGSNGRLTHTRTYNFDSGYGLEPGSYRVVISLRDFPNVAVEGTFVIEGNLGPQLSALRFNTTGNGASGVGSNTFPSGTQAVYAIFDYANIPLRAEIRRVWKYNGTVIIDVREAWDFNKYGTNGTITDVVLYDYTKGLASGSYDVEFSIVGQAGVVVRGSFVIQQAQQTPPSFNTLSFGIAPDSAAQSSFPSGTTLLYARWNYAHIPANSSLKVTWSHNGVVVRTDSATWTLGSSGATSAGLQNPAGLASGNWSAQIELVGYDTAKLTGNFTIEAAVQPTLGPIEMSATKGGTIVTTFPHTVGNLYAQFDFTNMPSGTPFQAKLTSADAGVNVTLTGTWSYVSNGRVTDLWIGNPTGPLAPGTYTLELSATAYNVKTTTQFVIQPPSEGQFDPTSVSYYVPPQINPSAQPPITADGLWQSASTN